MISHLTYDSKEQELEVLKIIMKDVAANITEEEWVWNLFKEYPKFQEFFKEGPLLDLAVLDITDERMLDRITKFRKEYREVMLMLIADTTISPMEYLKPSVMPTSLLLRPATLEQMRAVVKEFFEAYEEKRQNGSAEDHFVLETREGKTFLPYSKVFFFEAREKKVFVRAGNAEYAIYDTLENIYERLPECFLRCHRSYIVNKEKIERVQLSRNMIELKDGAVIPVSRSYRMDVKNV